MTNIFEGTRAKPIESTNPVESTQENIFAGTRARPLDNTALGGKIENTALKGNTASTSTSTGTPVEGNPVSAVVGGLSNAGANIVSTPVKATYWLLEKVGAISPTTKKALDKALNEDMDIFRSGDGKTNDTFDRSVQAYPKTAKVAELAAEAPALMKASLPSLGGVGLLGKANNLLGNVATNSFLSAGMTDGGTDNQDQAAKYSIPLTLGATAVGAGLKAMAKPGILINDLKKTIEPINQELKNNNYLSITDKAGQSISNLANKVTEISTDNWDTIKSIPGTIRTDNIKQQLKYMLTKNGSKLTANGWDHTNSLLEKPQLNALTSIADKALNLNNMDDAIALKHAAGSGYSNFTNKTDSIYTLYKNIQNNIDDAIRYKAVESGKGSDWVLANKFHKDVVVPLQDSNAFDIAKSFANKDTNPKEYALAMQGLFTKARRSPEAMMSLLNSMDSNGSEIIQQQFVKDIFKDIIDSPAAFNPNKALLQINTFKNQFGKVLSRDTRNTLSGIQTLLKNSGAQAGAKEALKTTQLVDKSSLAGGSVGSGIGWAVGGFPGSVAGGMIGGAATHVSVNMINKFLNTNRGLKVLQYIGKQRPGYGIISKAISTALPAEISSVEEE